MKKHKTMVIRNKHNVIIAHNNSTGTDNIICNAVEFDLQVGQKVIVNQIDTMFVEILSIK